jgi:hypothetical protein
MIDPSRSLVRELQTPRAAAIAGILFSLLLAAAVLLIQWAVPRDGDLSEWVTQDSRRRAVAVAMGLIPYAGIAFLWFIGVIRSRLSDLEDRFFATAFLGSGLLFVAMLFTAGALTGAFLDVYDGAEPVTSGDARLSAAIVTALLSTFGIRMAAVFTVVVTNPTRVVLTRPFTPDLHRATAHRSGPGDAPADRERLAGSAPRRSSAWSRRLSRRSGSQAALRSTRASAH